MRSHEIKGDEGPNSAKLIEPPKPEQEQLPLVVHGRSLRAESPVKSQIWKDLGYESPEAYMEWIRRVADNDKPLFRSTAPGGHKKYEPSE